jgi:hypothetical protein
VSDRYGRHAAIDRTVKVGPWTEFELLDTVQVRGPRTGDGVRHFRVHWRGVNVGQVCMGADFASGVSLNGSERACERVPVSDVWGPIERVTYFSVQMPAGTAQLLVEREGLPTRGPLLFYAISAEIDGCDGGSDIHYRHLDWRTDMTVGGPMETPMTPPDEPEPEPGTSWMPECRWTCDTTSPAGWIRTDSRRTMRPGDCPTDFQFEICRFDDRPVGTMLSVCSGERTPAGWDTLSTSSSSSRCAGSPYTNNVKLIQRRD